MFVEFIIAVASSVFFVVSSGLMYFFHKEFVGGESSVEWKIMYAGLLVTGLSGFLLALYFNTDISVLNTVSELAFLAGAATISVSSFKFWNKFRL